MKEIHDRIFLQWYGIDEFDRIEGEPLPEAVEVTWCADQVFDTDIEYVRADREMQEIHAAHIAPLEQLVADLRRENERLQTENIALRDELENCFPIGTTTVRPVFPIDFNDDALCDEIDKAVSKPRKPASGGEKWSRRWRYYSEGDYSELDY